MAKSKPIGVRFDLIKLESIKKEHNLTSYQSVINFLMNKYFKKEPTTVLMTPWGDRIGPNLAFKPENGTTNAESKKTPPNGLKGIDLAIWKLENWK